MSARDAAARIPISRGQATAVVLVVVLGAGAVGWNAVRGAKVDTGVAQAWDIKGPACEPLTAEQFAATRYRVRQGFEYDGIVISRRSGHVDCRDVKQAGGLSPFIDRVCQFTGPTVITVKTKAQTFYYFPGEGQPATIVIHDGQPRCVKASNFTLQSELERIAPEQAG